MSDTTHTAFFGDAEHTFKLTAPMILELERLSGAGIGTIYRRCLAAEFRLSDLSEVIRLGLIGAGEHPETAKSLVAAYVAPAPLMESYALAVAILSAVMLGTNSEREAA